MANYFVSYDLNGRQPSHDEMDKHLKKLGRCVHRVLETVWYIKTEKSMTDLHTYMMQILSGNDASLVIEASNASFKNLLIPDRTLLDCWSA